MTLHRDLSVTKRSRIQKRLANYFCVAGVLILLRCGASWTLKQTGTQSCRSILDKMPYYKQDDGLDYLTT